MNALRSSWMLAVAALSGCSLMTQRSHEPPPVDALTKTCKHNDPASCTLTVTASTAGDGTCSVSVGEWNVVQVEHGNQDAEITWNLVSGDGKTYRFATVGVVFGNDDQLKLKSAAQEEVVYKDKNADHKNYSYTVLVVRPEADADKPYDKCEPLDPWIYNQ